MKKIKKMFLVVMALVVVSALAACGGGSGQTTAAAGGEGETTAAAGNAGGGGSTNGKASNSVTVGIAQDLDSLDPHKAVYAGTREVLFNIFDGLVKPTSTGELENAVASDFKVAQDATSITFTLRDGVKFSDGTPVTAKDVKYSIERYAGIQGKESAFADFKDVVIKDEKTIVVELNKANSEFIFELTCAILPESNEANVSTAPIGVGPFKVGSYTPGERLVVTKNENYWKEGCPYLNEVTFKIVTKADTAISELNAGTLDIYQYLTGDQAKAVDSSKFNILEGSVNYVQGMFLNNAAKPFTDARVRQAVYYAVNRNMVSEMLFDGKSHIIGTNMIPALTKYYNADTETTYTRDLDKAKELLKQAGYENGFTFTITVPTNYAPHEGTAQIIAENLAEIGITAKIEPVDFNTWYSDVYVDRKYEATVVAVDGRLAPFSFFEKNVTGAPNNFTNYSNKEFDSTYAQALAEIDLDAKVDLYKKCQQILADDAASIYVQDPSNLVAVNSALEGYVFYPISAQDMSVVKFK